MKVIWRPYWAAMSCVDRDVSSMPFAINPWRNMFFLNVTPLWAICTTKKSNMKWYTWMTWMYEMQIKFIKFPQKFISHAMFCPSAGCQRLSPVDFNPGTNSLAKLPKRKFIFQAPIFRCELLGLGNVYTCNLPYTTYIIYRVYHDEKNI